MWKPINEREAADQCVRIGVGTASADLSVEQLHAAMQRGREERARAFAAVGGTIFGWLGRWLGRRQTRPVAGPRPAGAAC